MESERAKLAEKMRHKTAQAKVLREEMARIGARPPLSSFGIWMLGPALLHFGTGTGEFLHHLRDAGAGITPKGVRISARAAAPRTPRAGRRASEAIEELSFDDPPPAPRNNGGFRPRGGYRR